MEVRMENITKKFNDVIAVDNLNLGIKDGELVTILGPSGCGKSTTLLMLAGLYKPSKGRIYFGEYCVNEIEPENRNIGMVFQNYALYPHMKVIDNIMFPLEMLKIPCREALDRAETMAELVQIENLLDRKPSQLSGGQKQRVAIARALVKEPTILLLDEPLSNLDARLRLKTREEIRKIQQEVGITTIYVTHDQQEAMSISDRVLVMKDGRYQQYDRPQQLYFNPANQFVARFLGEHPINIINLELDIDKQRAFLEGTDKTIDIPESIKFSAGNNDLRVGIRPEDWIIGTDESYIVEGEVEIIEVFGRNTLVKVRAGQLELRVLFPSDLQLEVGDILKLDYDQDYIHFFQGDGTSYEV